MNQRVALILFWLIIWSVNKIVQVWFAWCIIFNPKRATEIALAYDRVGNVSMGQGNETISSWAGRRNSWMEPYIDKLFFWLNGEQNHCNNNTEYVRDTMKVLIVAAWLALMPVPAHTATVELSWDANPAADMVTNYKIFYGNYSGSTNTFVPVGTVSTGTATVGRVENLSPLQKWFFRVTAANAVQESLYSNVVSVQFIRTPASVKFQKLEIR